MNIETFAIGLGLLAAGIVIGAVVTLLVGRVAALERKVKELEDCRSRRLPYNTDAGIEDSLAVNMDLVRAANELEVKAQALRLRAGQQAEILKLVRQGPEAYDPEKPAGRRPKGME